METKNQRTSLKTCIVLFIIGILLSTQLMSQSGDTVLLTEDNTIHFSGQVTDASVAKAQQELGLLSSRLSPNATIYLVIDSPGGSVPAGNLFIDFASSLSQKIKPICVACASMGYHMFQSFDERLVLPSSELMSHRVSVGGIGGQVPGEATSRIAYILAVSNEMDEKVAKRLGQSVQQYRASIYDELWLSGSAAVKQRHADRIPKIRCSKELITKTKTTSVDTLFGPVDVTTSKCPLITGILGLKFDKTKFSSQDFAEKMVRQAKKRTFWSF